MDDLYIMWYYYPLKMVHDTPSRQKPREMKTEASALQKEARTLATIEGANILAAERESKASELREAASKMEDAARLEDLSVREVDYWKGTKNYPRWIASWREGDRIRTVYLGSCKKIGRKEALGKARRLKAEGSGKQEGSLSILPPQFQELYDPPGSMEKSHERLC